MIDRKMLGLMVAVLGIAFVVSGTIMFLVELPEPSSDAFCGFCLIKRPIYCLKTFHGVLFDVGWLLTIAGSIIMFFYRKEKLTQTREESLIHQARAMVKNGFYSSLGL